MESYYSSDEEIAWGPITLREIKGDLKRGPRRKPNRRHTVLCKIQNTKMDESPSEAVNKLEISETSTAYYTPNDSLRTNTNSEFLEKLSHVINAPSLEVSEYASILEHTENTNRHSEDIDNHNEPLIIPHILITEPVESSGNDSCADFVMAVENRETQYNIENFHQTLVENSYGALEEQITSEDESAANKKDSVETRTTETEVIILSDGSSNAVEDSEDISYDEIITSCEKDFDIYKNELDKCVSTVDQTEHTQELNNKHKLEEQKWEAEGPSDAERTSDHHQEENNLVTPNMERKLSIIKESFSKSPVIVPEIDLTQFDDSLKNESLQLNDTLEEMNRLLCQGLNYSMSDEETNESIPKMIEKSNVPTQLITPSTTPSKHLLSDVKEKTSHIPRYIPTSAEKKTTTHSVTKVSPKTNFKMPQLPPRPKFATPTQIKSSRNNLKNIISPVGLYIKNSPRTPLKQNVPLRELPRIVTSTSAKPCNKENFIDVELPEVVYRPAKNQIETREKHIIIPLYLRKLNVKEAQITKHEGRINCQLNKSQVSKRLLQSDITNSTVDQSFLDNSGAADISVLTNKQAFIK